MAIVPAARDHVPMQMLREVAEAREVDLIGSKDLAERRLGREYGIHQSRALRRCEIGHFLYVPFEDHPTEARIIGIVDQHDTAKPVPPEQISARRIAQPAGFFDQTFPPGRRPAWAHRLHSRRKDSRITSGYGLVAFDGGSAGTGSCGKMSR